VIYGEEEYNRTLWDTLKFIWSKIEIEEKRVNPIES